MDYMANFRSLARTHIVPVGAEPPDTSVAFTRTHRAPCPHAVHAFDYIDECIRSAATEPKWDGGRGEGEKRTSLFTLE